MNHGYKWAIRLLNVIVLVPITVSINAQSLKGVVTDENLILLENAGIFNQTTWQHSQTNLSGVFSLPVTQVNDSVYFSNLGFKTVVLIVEEKHLTHDINISLQESSINLDQVVVIPKVDALSRVVNVDIQRDPVKSSQEILRKIAGLLIGQHAGGGKAE